MQPLLPCQASAALCLPHVQAHLRKHWAPGFSGTINGQQLDLAALSAHWTALQVGPVALLPGACGAAGGPSGRVPGMLNRGRSAAALVSDQLPHVHTPPTCICASSQTVLTAVLIDVKQSVVHGNCVAAIYHVLCGHADRQVGGFGTAGWQDLSMLASFVLCIPGSSPPDLRQIIPAHHASGWQAFFCSCSSGALFKQCTCARCLQHSLYCLLTSAVHSCRRLSCGLSPFSEWTLPAAGLWAAMRWCES